MKEPDRNPRKALGKGLSALLPSRSVPDAGSGTAAAPALAPVRETNRSEMPERFESFESIPLHHIRPGREQPRTNFDAERLTELAQSIKANGVIQPITVTRIAPDEFQIIAGERRWKAAGIAGLTEIPALVREAEQHEMLEMALIENIQREDLNAIEVALAFQRLAEEHGFSHEQIAERTGKERSTITNFLRLLRLSEHVQEEIIRGTISAGHARALLNLNNEQQQSKICDEIIARQLSVRATEQLVKNLTSLEIPRKGSAPDERPTIDPNVRAAIEEMEMALGTRVKLVAKSDKAGRLEIEYYSHEDLDRIYAVIVKQ